MASTKTIEAKLDKLSGDLMALRLEVQSSKMAKRKSSPDAKTSWQRLGRKVSRSWKRGAAAEEIAKQREKDA